MNAFLFYHDHHYYLVKIFGRPPAVVTFSSPPMFSWAYGPLFWLAGDDVKGLAEAAATTDEGGTFMVLGRLIGDRSSVMKKRNEGGPGDEAGRP